MMSKPGSELEAIRSALHQALDGLERAGSAIEDQAAQAQAERSGLHGRIQELEAAEKAAQQSQRESELELAALRERIAEVETTEKAGRLARVDIERELASTRQHANELGKKLTDAETALEQSRAASQEADANRAQVLSQLHDAMDERGSIAERLARVETEHAQAQERERELRATTSAQIDALGQRLAQLQAEAESKASEYEDMDADLEMLREANSFLTSEVERVTDERDNLLRAKSTLDNELEAEKREKTELAEELSELSGEWDITELRAQLEAARTGRDTLDTLEETIHTSHDEGASNDQLQAMFDREMDMARKIIAQLEAQFEDTEAKIAGYRDELVKQRHINAELHEKLTKLATHFKRRGIVESVAPNANGKRTS